MYAAKRGIHSRHTWHADLLSRNSFFCPLSMHILHCCQKGFLYYPDKSQFNDAGKMAIGHEDKMFR